MLSVKQRLLEAAVEHLSSQILKSANERQEEERSQAAEREELVQANSALKQESQKLLIKLEEKEKYVAWYSDSLA